MPGFRSISAARPARLVGLPDAPAIRDVRSGGDFGPESEALDRAAAVIRTAHPDRHGLARQAAGLLAVSAGLSRQYSDDLEQLGAGLHLCDALCRWARDGHDEGHDDGHGWPAGRRQ